MARFWRVRELKYQYLIRIDMEKIITKQLTIIESAIKWVKETDSMKGTKGDNASRQLIEFRRTLKKKKYALEGNPAAAIYGASQMGKSYLVSNLLSENGNPFTVLDGAGKQYVFLDEINPEGRGREATSLVTRFSTNYQWPNPEFPIKAKLLSPSDLILVLCDSYFNDVKSKIDNALTGDIINEKVKELWSKFEGRATNQKLLDEDHLIDIYEYFHRNFSTKASTIIHSTFFTKISPIISKTNSGDWIEIFSLLWNNNPKITKLFSELLNNYAKLDFADELYLPIDAVLRKKGTLLDVARLRQIYEETIITEIEYEAETKILIIKDGGEKVIPNFSKSFLCALTAELTFCLDKNLEENKSFLKNTDLLDFPGARNRLGIHEDELTDENTPNMLLRGKVAFLFNKYSYSEKINILLFCQNSAKVEVQNIVPDLIDNWIGDMIGKSPEERNTFISTSQVPPLFVISTMFNVDLQFDYNNDLESNIDARNNRWKGRFITVFNEIFGTKKWINEWTTDKPNFQNIYLLRDFRFSSDTASKLFKGYNEKKKELEEIFNNAYPNFRQDLRKSFIEFDFVKQHFENPANSWDRAASINEDGTQLIIDKLTLAAHNINTARFDKTARELTSLNERIINLLKEYYNSSDKAEILKKAVQTAGNIQANLSISFGRDPYFFGSLMRELMLNSSDVYNLYLTKIGDIERRDVVNMDKYIGLRLQVPNLNPNESFDTNLEFLRIQYEKRSLEECQDYFEIEMGIDLNELFFGNKERVKSFSQVLAKELEIYWLNIHMAKSQRNLSGIISIEDLKEIQEMLSRLYEKLNMTEKIAERIRNYVDGYRNIENVYEMIADISAEMINKFINTAGSEYYNSSNFTDLEKVSEQIHGLCWKHDDLAFEHNSKKEVADLITQMANLPELLNQNPLPKEKIKLLPNYRNYMIWYDLLKVAFVTASGVPNYDPVANEKLGAIIEATETIEI